jgi:hypothetical protein
MALRWRLAYLALWIVLGAWVGSLVVWPVEAAAATATATALAMVRAAVHRARLQRRAARHRIPTRPADAIDAKDKDGTGDHDDDVEDEDEIPATPQPPPLPGQAKRGAGGWAMPVPRAKQLVLRDGVRLTYYVVPGVPGARTMVFAAGLSCASTFHLWAAPVVHRFGRQYTYVYWEYRGLFQSARPKRPRRLAIPEHAEDLRELCRREGLDRIDVLIGHSMGCQVSLEFALLYPECVDKIVLSNGGHGRICSSFLQPLVRVPGSRQVLFLLFRLVLAAVYVVVALCMSACMCVCVRECMSVHASTFSSRALGGGICVYVCVCGYVLFVSVFMHLLVRGSVGDPLPASTAPSHYRD